MSESVNQSVNQSVVVLIAWHGVAWCSVAYYGFMTYVCGLSHIGRISGYSISHVKLEIFLYSIQLPT